MHEASRDKPCSIIYILAWIIEGVYEGSSIYDTSYRYIAIQLNFMIIIIMT